MEKELCMFCSNNDENYIPATNCKFICSSCVILLAGADQDDLKKAYAKASDKKNTRMAQAIHSFIERTEDNEQRNKGRKLKRNNNRTRALRSARNKKK